MQPRQPSSKASVQAQHFLDRPHDTTGTAQGARRATSDSLPESRLWRRPIEIRAESFGPLPKRPYSEMPSAAALLGNNELGRHHAHRVTKLGELSGPVVGTRTRFHADQARRQVGNECEQFGSRHFGAHQHGACQTRPRRAGQRRSWRGQFQRLRLP